MAVVKAIDYHSSGGNKALCRYRARNRLLSRVRAMEKCGTKEAFINYMKAAGYEVRWNNQYKNIKYICTDEPKYKNGDGANAKSLIHQHSRRRIKRRSVQAA